MAAPSRNLLFAGRGSGAAAGASWRVRSRQRLAVHAAGQKEFNERVVLGRLKYTTVCTEEGGAYSGQSKHKDTG